MEWPAYYPPNCPPSTCRNPAGKVYRFVEHNPPSAQDFIPHLLRYPDAYYNNPCTAAGLSVYTSYDDIARARRRFSKFRQQYVAAAQLNDALGKMDSGNEKNRTLSSHTTWWVPNDIDPLPYFAIFTK